MNPKHLPASLLVLAVTLYLLIDIRLGNKP